MSTNPPNSGMPSQHQPGPTPPQFGPPGPPQPGHPPYPAQGRSSGFQNPQFGAAPIPPKRPNRLPLFIVLGCLVGLVLFIGAPLVFVALSKQPAQTLPPPPSSAGTPTSNISTTPDETSATPDETSATPDETSATPDETSTPTAAPSEPTLAVGNCISLTDVGGGRVAARMVTCADEPSYTVMSILDGGQAECPAVYAHFTITSSTRSYLYCMAENTTAGKCYLNSTEARKGLTPVACTSGRTKVVLVRDGVADASICGADQKAIIYPDGPKRTVCNTPA